MLMSTTIVTYSLDMSTSVMRLRHHQLLLPRPTDEKVRLWHLPEQLLRNKHAISVSYPLYPATEAIHVVRISSKSELIIAFL